MTFKRPVIVSHRVALPEGVRSQENGWVFDPDDPQTLTECLRAILLDRKDAERRAVSGRRRVEEIFRYDNWAKQIASIFLNVALGNISGNGR